MINACYIITIKYDDVVLLFSKKKNVNDDIFSNWMKTTEVSK